ncbi:DUF4180 domain-containing protein [Rubrolithibacter danxiaensis]|uniref:DUF4180 domain-containing protein n=1 Tax=Rubrolithibacter danxiaensis TaxID=3390805 RepID=UPI003BF86DD1
MEITVSDFNKVKIAELVSDKIEINTVDDALDLIGNSGYLGAAKVIIYEKNLNPDFFDLKTRLAGEILQKFSNYNLSLAIVGDFSKFNSKSLKDFIYESNKRGRIVFAKDVNKAKEQLARD